MLTKNDLKQISLILREEVRPIIREEIENMGVLTKEDAKNFVTKEDAKNFATKDDLRNFATKDDLKNFATKDDLRNFATKDDIKKLQGYIIDVLEYTNNLSEIFDARLTQLEKIHNIAS